MMKRKFSMDEVINLTENCYSVALPTGFEHSSKIMLLLMMLLTCVI